MGVSALTKSARSTAQAGRARCWMQSAFSILRGITCRSRASKHTPARCFPASSDQRAFRFARSSAGSTAGVLHFSSALPDASFASGAASGAASVARGLRAFMKSARSMAQAGNTLCWMHRPLSVFRGRASRSASVKRISPRCSAEVFCLLAGGSSSSCCAGRGGGAGAAVLWRGASAAGSGAAACGCVAKGARTWRRLVRSTVPGGSTPRWVQRARRVFVGMPSRSASVNSC
mmetsp:Transcript_53817/g.160457  ORF Transcript_53817/g.160457 Transcript_53817/m.160457 type:complete len:232 (-) Transcript_53817:1109-1804(-)